MTPRNSKTQILVKGNESDMKLPQIEYSFL